MSCSIPILQYSNHAAVLSDVEAAVATVHACIVTDFPRDLNEYLHFLRALGTPLSNYGQGQDSNLPMYSLHECVNRVICLDRSADNKYLHEQGGALSVHAARSWRDPRPRFFVMLMVDPGFRTGDADGSGWSLFVRWAEAYRLLAAEDPTAAALLLDTPVAFAADHVREPVSSLPIVFRLPDGTVGARIRGPFESTWKSLRNLELNEPERSAYKDALECFIAIANRAPACEVYAAPAGALMVLDNNRVGHGRTRAAFRVSGEEGQHGINRRELWSACID